jgi:protein-tyrosine phosphatase
VIDLHSHLLPGVDDGSRTVEQSVRVLREIAGLGITDVCLTPHLTASRAEQGIPPAYDEAFAALSAVAPPDVRLHRGAEVMLDRPLGPAAVANPAIRLNGTRYILVEFPRIVPRDTVRNALQLVSEAGLIPVLAHPERYSSCSVPAAGLWRTTGAKLQVDANTLLTSRSRGERARALLAAGMADILAADNHGDDRTLAAAHASLSEHGAAEQAAALTVRNPRAILDDRELEPVEPVTFTVSLLQRLRRLLDGGEG